MYFFIPLILSSAVLGLPHQIRNPQSTSLLPSHGACPGAPPLPNGAHPGDDCNTGSPSSATPSHPPSRRGPLRKRQITSTQSACQAVTLDQYQSSPMKAGLESQATTNWGSDFTVVVNPSDFPDSPLHFCYTGNTVPAAFDNPPTCSASINHINGNIANGSADVTLSVVEGTTATHEFTTQQASSITSTTTVGLSIGIPDIADIKLEQSLAISGTFTQGQTSSTTDNQQSTATVVAHGTKPGPCSVAINVTTCTGQATAIVPAFFTGFVWYDYGSTRDGHFKWALNVDSSLPAEQRSSNTTLTDKITATNTATFNTDCV